MVLWVILGLPPNEPQYRGIRLTSWLERLSQSNAAAEIAIRSIGTNAIPSLLVLLQPKDTEIRKRLFRSLPAEWLTALNLSSDLSRQLLAYKAFEILGSNAVSAMPTLAGLLNNTNANYAAAMALAAIGPEGVAVLDRGLSHTNWLVRRNVVLALGYAHSAPEPALKSLLKCLHDEHFVVRWAATDSIGQLLYRDKAVISALMDSLRDSNRSVRYGSLKALAKYGTEALQAAPIVGSMTNDHDALVRETAISTLQQITQTRAHEPK